MSSSTKTTHRVVFVGNRSITIYSTYNMTTTETTKKVTGSKATAVIKIRDERVVSLVIHKEGGPASTEPIELVSSQTLSEINLWAAFFREVSNELIN